MAKELGALISKVNAIKIRRIDIRRTESERLSLATNHEMSAIAHTAPVRNAGRVTLGLMTGNCE